MILLHLPPKQRSTRVPEGQLGKIGHIVPDMSWEMGQEQSDRNAPPATAAQPICHDGIRTSSSACFIFLWLGTRILATAQTVPRPTGRPDLRWTALSMQCRLCCRQLMGCGTAGRQGCSLWELYARLLHQDSPTCIMSMGHGSFRSDTSCRAAAPPGFREIAPMAALFGTACQFPMPTNRIRQSGTYTGASARQDRSPGMPITIEPSASGPESIRARYRPPSAHH